MLNFANSKRSNHSTLSGGPNVCQECGSRQYPCEKSLELVKEELKLFIMNAIEQKLIKMSDSIDESIGIEENLDVNDPNILNEKYKNTKTDNQRLYNIALLAYKAKHYSKQQRDKRQNSQRNHQLQIDQDINENISKGL